MSTACAGTAVACPLMTRGRARLITRTIARTLSAIAIGFDGAGILNAISIGFGHAAAKHNIGCASPGDDQRPSETENQDNREES